MYLPREVPLYAYQVDNGTVYIVRLYVTGRIGGPNVIEMLFFCSEAQHDWVMRGSESSRLCQMLNVPPSPIRPRAPIGMHPLPANADDLLHRAEDLLITCLLYTSPSPRD